MNSISKTFLYGFLTWLIPFVLAIPFYSKDGQLSIDIFLFKTIMMLGGAIAGAWFLILYFRKVTEAFLREGVRLGLIWLAINLLLDFLILIPMSGMSVDDYIIQIGLRYLMIPIFSTTIGCLLSFHKTSR